MPIHISTRRNAALDLLQRGIVTKSEAAQLLGESPQAFSYMARGIDAKAALAQYLDELWRAQTTRRAKTKTKLRRRDEEKK